METSLSLGKRFIFFLGELLLEVFGSLSFCFNLRKAKVLFEIHVIEILGRDAWSESVNIIPKMGALGHFTVDVFAFHYSLNFISK